MRWIAVGCHCCIASPTEAALLVVDVMVTFTSTFSFTFSLNYSPSRFAESLGDGTFRIALIFRATPP